MNTQLDTIFSENFINAEKEHLTTLSKEIPILQNVPLDEYVKERRHVVYNLFRLAWDRTTPHSNLILYAFIFIMLTDPRVKAINSGLYDMCIVHAQRAGIDTFEFMSRLFVGQIIPSDVYE